MHLHYVPPVGNRMLYTRFQTRILEDARDRNAVMVRLIIARIQGGIGSPQKALRAKVSTRTFLGVKRRTLPPLPGEEPQFNSSGHVLPDTFRTNDRLHTTFAVGK